MSVRKQTFKDTFPLPESHRAAEFLVNTWERIRISKADYIKKLKEPKVTETLAFYLKRLKTEARLTGDWTYEIPSLETEPEETPVVRTRKDIRYFSNAGNEVLELVFEFKFLKPTKSSIKIYMGADGMGRFADGHYCRDSNQAAMVALIDVEKEQCVTKLKDSFNDDICTQLKMRGNGTGGYLTSPSALFETLAEFDTEHERPAVNGIVNTTKLAHIFLSMPN